MCRLLSFCCCCSYICRRAKCTLATNYAFGSGGKVSKLAGSWLSISRVDENARARCTIGLRGRLLGAGRGSACVGAGLGRLPLEFTRRRRLVQLLEVSLPPSPDNGFLGLDGLLHQVWLLLVFQALSRNRNVLVLRPGAGTAPSPGKAPPPSRLCGRQPVPREQRHQRHEEEVGRDANEGRAERPVVQQVPETREVRINLERGSVHLYELVSDHNARLSGRPLIVLLVSVKQQDGYDLLLLSRPEHEHRDVGERRKETHHGRLVAKNTRSERGPHDLPGLGNHVYLDRKHAYPLVCIRFRHL
uniref:Uncharacterized protein n=1 Tax=Ixodes ricinus TaxID=34613 RepID=A0A6B0V737_IXORI